MLGCLGCAAARSMLLLDAMRAVAGFGGGGLITMGTRLRLSFLAAGLGCVLEERAGGRSSSLFCAS